MKLSVNGQSLVPPGFRFHPTEEELLHYYLPKKVANDEIDLNVIRDVDLNKLEPWDIQEKCKIGSGPQSDWYFFSHKDKKYPTGTRTNRATAAGFWKATGRDKVIKSGCTRIGMRKTLVFYRGRAPRGQKSDWIMHEYRLDENNSDIGGGGAEEGWVVCRVFKKKSYLHDKSTQVNTTNTSTSNDDNILDQILMYMGTPSSANYSHQTPHPEISFPHLPGLEESPTDGPSSGWAALDRMVASQLNAPNQELCCFPFGHDDHDEVQLLDCMKQGTDDFWPFARTSSSSSPSSSSPLSHLSV